MIEYRCEGTKKDGRDCNEQFFQGQWVGEITVKCHTCKCWTTFHESDYTASTADSIVDKNLVSV